MTLAKRHRRPSRVAKNDSPAALVLAALAEGPVRLYQTDSGAYDCVIGNREISSRTVSALIRAGKAERWGLELRLTPSSDA